MSRRKHSIKRPLRPDPRFNNLVLAKFINYLMLDGKKTTAQAAAYGALDLIESKKKEPIETFSRALQNVTPRMELRSKRIGGANYQIPYEVAPERGVFLAMKWLIEAARKKGGTSMDVRLSQELMDASAKQGEAFRKKEEIHRMAEANKAFAHFGRRR